MKGKLQEKSQNDRATILVVDDAEVQRMVLSEQLKVAGFDVLVSSNGLEAIERVGEGGIDLVLMDVEMPKMNGVEAASKIKEMTIDKCLLPIIFVTILDNDEQLISCIDAGGDDFIAKPVNSVILKAKIKAMLRMSRFFNQQAAQKEALLKFQNSTVHEQEIAAEIFKKIVHEGNLDVPNIKHLLSPMSLFNGDLLLAAHTPTGKLQVLLGDFTGHGLIASIGAGPTAEIFYGMTAKGFGVEEIIPEINKKLCRVLPTGMFLASCLFSFDHQQGLVSLFTGGLPEHLLFSKDSGKVVRIASSNLPLGIIDNEQSDFVFEHFEVGADQRLYLFTDGIIESRNKNNKEAGIDGIEWCLQNRLVGKDEFDSIIASQERFVGCRGQEDDLTLVQVSFDPALALYSASNKPQKAKVPAAWQASMVLCTKALKTTNPVPLMVNQVMELQGLHAYRESIYTIVTELFINALDHGLLELNSKLKESPEGFMRYFELREERLNLLERGQVELSFKHQPTALGGQLTIIIRDNGRGFEAECIEENLSDNQGYSGRGIPLVKKLCRSLSYSDEGRRAKAVFDWEYKD